MESGELMTDGGHDAVCVPDGVETVVVGCSTEVVYVPPGVEVVRLQQLRQNDDDDSLPRAPRALSETDTSLSNGPAALPSVPPLKLPVADDIPPPSSSSSSEEDDGVVVAEPLSVVAGSDDVTDGLYDDLNDGATLPMTAAASAKRRNMLAAVSSNNNNGASVRYSAHDNHVQVDWHHGAPPSLAKQTAQCCVDLMCCWMGL